MKGSQTRWGSFVEAWVNIFVGFGIAFVANAVILPVFGFTALSAAKNFYITCLFTVISFVRSYCLRRLFNSLRLFHHESEEKRKARFSKEVSKVSKDFYG